MSNIKKGGSNPTRIRLENVRATLSNRKFKLDYYQREYQWEREHVLTLVKDLKNNFMRNYQSTDDSTAVANYSQYFMGSIILENRKNDIFIIDGQQRLSTLTLLLLILRNKLSELEIKEEVTFDECIFTIEKNNMSFNISIQERISFMNAKLGDSPYDSSGKPQSVVNLNDRYTDIKEEWPHELTNKVLPYFIEWLLTRVNFVEISTNSEFDAYSIFDTMNNRGLSLKQPDYFKSFLLSRIDDQVKRETAAEKWNKLTSELNGIKKGLDATCIKTWLCCKYANNIIKGKGKRFQDFEKIETEFHHWIRESHEICGLENSDSFFNFIDNEFTFYAKNFVNIYNASKLLDERLEHVHYAFQLEKASHFMVLLSTLKLDDKDKPDLIKQKVDLTARFIENLHVRMIWNEKSTSTKEHQVELFEIMKNIRGNNLNQLVSLFKKKLKESELNFDPESMFGMKGSNRNNIRCILARLTDWVQVTSGLDPIYKKLMHDKEYDFQIEHIWPENHNSSQNKELTKEEFQSNRNCLGGLILLPGKINNSIGNLPFEEKRDDYNISSKNLLASSLHDKCYRYEPIKNLMRKTNLPFKAYSGFGCDEIKERLVLYCKIAEKIWDPNELGK